MADELQLFYGEKYDVTETISILNPTIKNIKEYGENKYFSMVSTLVATPFDMIAQLDSIGIDFTKISDFEIFILFIKSFTKEDTEILFGNIDFNKYDLCETENGMVLKHNDSIINEFVYKLMTSHLRKMHNFEPPKYTTIGDEFTKKRLIEYAYDDLKFAKRKKVKSILKNYISYLIAKDGIQNYYSILDIPISTFFEILIRKQNNDAIDHIYTGIYTGNIDSNKIKKKELDYFKSLS